MATIIRLMFTFITIFYLSQAQADFIVKTNKQVDLQKNKEIHARMEDDNQIFNGYAQVEKTINFATQQEVYNVTIIWTTMTSKSGKLNLEGLTTNIELDKSILPSGTALLVKGHLPQEFNILNKKNDKDKDKRPANNHTTTGAPTTHISSPMQPPINPSNNNNLFQPKIITTYEGCQHTYDPKKEVITAYQQTYYYDKNGKKVQVMACTANKDYPAEHKPCTNFHDFKESFTYIRHQPYFIVNDPITKAQEAFSAGGCIPFKSYPHMLDYSVCPAIPVGDKYVKQGKWYYQTENGDKNYISNCILDPENQMSNLEVQFEGCPVTHDIDNNQSFHLGKYYYIKPDNTKEYLSECIPTKQSYYKHQLSWDGKWKHLNSEWYSQRIFTRYIYIEKEKRKIIINNDEIDSVRYPHIEKHIGWKDYDDTNRGSPNGYSNKIMKRVVPFNGIEYFTDHTYEGQKVKHTYLYTNWTGKKQSCGTWFKPGVRRWYEDIIKRPQGSEYKTNEFDKGCER